MATYLSNSYICKVWQANCFVQLTREAWWMEQLVFLTLQFRGLLQNMFCVAHTANILLMKSFLCERAGISSSSNVPFEVNTRAALAFRREVTNSRSKIWKSRFTLILDPEIKIHTELGFLRIPWRICVVSSFSLYFLCIKIVNKWFLIPQFKTHIFFVFCITLLKGT